MTMETIEAGHLPGDERRDYLAATAAKRLVEQVAEDIKGDADSAVNFMVGIFAYACDMVTKAKASSQNNISQTPHFDASLESRDLLKTNAGSNADLDAQLLLDSIATDTGLTELRNESVRSYSLTLEVGRLGVSFDVMRLYSQRDRQAHYMVHNLDGGMPPANSVDQA